MPHRVVDLRRLLAPGLGGFLALSLYARSLPPGLTWAHNGADGGDLLAAALTSGVPHPTGYPTYQLLLRLAIALSSGTPARAGAWLSATCAALAVALLIDLAQRTVRHCERGHRAAAASAGLAAGLAWAASPSLWGQANIVEVYALNGLVCVALLWLAWRWSEALAEGGATRPWLVATGLVFGAGLGNHLSVLLMLPGLSAWFWLTARHTAGSRGLGRDLGVALLAAVAVLLVYLYLPLAASHRPPINWGDPSSLAPLLWVATGRLYAGLVFGLPLRELPSRLLGWATWTARQFQPWGLLLGLAGLRRLDRISRPWWLTTLLIWLAFTLYATGYNTTDSLTYLIPAFAVMALWIAEALYAGFQWAEPRAARVAVIAAAFAALPIAAVALNWQSQDLSRDHGAEWFLQSALDRAAVGSVILTAGDERTFALWYAVYGLRRRQDLAILNVNLYGYEWYRRTLAETGGDLLPSANEAPPIESLITDLLSRRPVYAAEELNLNLPGVTQQREGVLTRLNAP